MASTITFLGVSYDSNIKLSPGPQGYSQLRRLVNILEFHPLFTAPLETFMLWLSNRSH